MKRCGEPIDDGMESEPKRPRQDGGADCPLLDRLTQDAVARVLWDESLTKCDAFALALTCTALTHHINTTIFERFYQRYLHQLIRNREIEVKFISAPMIRLAALKRREVALQTHRTWNDVLDHAADGLVRWTKYAAEQLSRRSSAEEVRTPPYEFGIEPMGEFTVHVSHGVPTKIVFDGELIAAADSHMLTYTSLVDGDASPWRAFFRRRIHHYGFGLWLYYGLGSPARDIHLADILGGMEPPPDGPLDDDTVRSDDDVRREMSCYHCRHCPIPWICYMPVRDQ